MHSLMCPVYYKRSCVLRLEDVRVRLVYDRLRLEFNRLSIDPADCASGVFCRALQAAEIEIATAWGLQHLSCWCVASRWCVKISSCSSAGNCSSISAGVPSLDACRDATWLLCKGCKS